MQKKETSATIDIRNETQTREYWASRPYVASDLRPRVLDAGLLLVPDERVRGVDIPLFPAGTSDFYDCIKDVAPDVTVEVCADEDAYKELALHGDVIFVVGIIAQFLLAPITVQVIAEYIKRRLPLGLKSGEVKSTITLEKIEGDHRTAITIQYEGPAAEFESKIRPAVQQAQQQLQGTPPAQLPPTSMTGSSPGGEDEPS